MFVWLTFMVHESRGAAMNEWSIYSALGEAVAIRRKAMRLTQAQVATKVGISRASIANIESGRQKVLLHQVYLLAEALKLPSIMSLLPKSLLQSGGDLAVPISRDDISERQKAQVSDALMGMFASSPAITATDEA
jgi:transcriptional regulator with XRE-family HTH domain